MACAADQVGSGLARPTMRTFGVGRRGAVSSVVRFAPRKSLVMETIWISALVVAIAEIGDKTQLLAIVLAARFRRPIPIILGILAATLLNHGLAATLGYWLGKLLSGPVFQIAVGVGSWPWPCGRWSPTRKMTQP